ncbi:MAG: hypothetical protein ACC651_17045 [Candidatus Scalindua sp.]
MRPILIISVLLTIFFTGCSTERYVSPTIVTVQRTDIILEKPVLAAVYDGRTTGNNKGAASSLEAELKKIYGDNLEWVSYFDSTPKGRVSIKLRIIEFGSSFGSRLISSVSYAKASQTAKVVATGSWGPIVGTATGSSSVFGSSFSGEGWWNGAVWVDVEVQDHRDKVLGKFTIPLAAEHRESNMWGYSSGDKAARKAWEKVSALLTRTIDNVLVELRDSEGEK